MAWLWILLGLVVLVVGAEALVRGSAWIAEAMGIRPLIVGLTVVAIGTSAPELVISVIAANQGDTGLAIGNIFGSNTANLALILGATALVRPIDTSGARLRFELMWLLAASLVVFTAFVGGGFTRQLGIAMTLMIALFMVLLVMREKRSRPERRPSEQPTSRTLGGFLIHLGLTAVGLAGLIVGGRWLVDGAIEIAASLGMAKPVIGATIVAAGTSAPELATAIVAARRGHPELAVGNVVGSNLFNILLVLGLTSTITPIPVNWADHGIRILIPLALTIYVAILLLGKQRISKPAGAILLLSYLSYIIWEVLQVS